MTVKDMVKANDWLNGFAQNVNSQTGEDGIIEKVLDVIGTGNQWCVEFGAWDGKYLSNTYNLITNKAHSAVLIEGDSNRFSDLVENFEGNPNVHPLILICSPSISMAMTIMSGTL